MAYTNDYYEIPKRIQAVLNATGGTDIAPYLLIGGTEAAATLPTGSSSTVMGVSRKQGSTAGVAYGIKTGYYGDIGVLGRFPLTAGSAGWTAGDRLMPESGGTGRGVTITSITAGTNVTYVGRAIDTQTVGNVGLRADNTSGFRGASRFRNKWQAGIVVNGKREHIGHYDSKRDAALAYNKRAREVFGSFAFLNAV